MGNAVTLHISRVLFPRPVIKAATARIANQMLVQEIEQVNEHFVVRVEPMGDFDGETTHTLFREFLLDSAIDHWSAYGQGGDRPFPLWLTTLHEVDFALRLCNDSRGARILLEWNTALHGTPDVFSALLAFRARARMVVETLSPGDKMVVSIYPRPEDSVALMLEAFEEFLGHINMDG